MHALSNLGKLHRDIVPFNITIKFNQELKLFGVFISSITGVNKGRIFYCMLLFTNAQCYMLCNDVMIFL